MRSPKKFHTISNMRKDAPLAFRISGELKRTLQQIANKEMRSISQVCEILLMIGADAYKKDGSRYLERQLEKENK